MARRGGFLITRIKQVSDRIMERILGEYHIDTFSGAQGRILYVLWQKDGLSMSQLSRETGLAMTTLTSMIDRMEASGLVYRSRNTQDRRKVLIHLEESTRALEDDYNQVTEKMEAIYYEGFSEEEIDQFESYLERVLRNVEKSS